MTWKKLAINLVAVVVFFFGMGMAALSLAPDNLTALLFDVVALAAGLFLLLRVAAPVLATMAYYAMDENVPSSIRQSNVFKRYFLIGKGADQSARRREV